MLKLYFTTYSYTADAMIQKSRKDDNMPSVHTSLIPCEDDRNERDQLSILNSNDIDQIRRLTSNYKCDFGCHFDKKTRQEIEKAKQAQTKLLLASAFCVVFMIAELTGGYIAHSIALMSDALHLLSDCGGLMISVVALVSLPISVLFPFRMTQRFTSHFPVHFALKCCIELLHSILHSIFCPLICELNFREFERMERIQYAFTALPDILAH